MSDIGNVKQIHIINKGSFDATISTTKPAGTNYPMSSKVESGKDVTFDLTQVAGLKNGDKLQARVQADDGTGKTDPNVFTFTNASEWRAKYQVTGDAANPAVAYEGLEAITK